jgi:hypothetical protein
MYWAPPRFTLKTSFYPDCCIPLFFRQLLWWVDKLCHHRPVFIIFNIIDAANMSSRNNQNVERCLRADVIEGEDRFSTLNTVSSLSANAQRVISERT